MAVAQSHATTTTEVDRHVFMGLVIVADHVPGERMVRALAASANRCGREAIVRALNDASEREGHPARAEIAVSQRQADDVRARLMMEPVTPPPGGHACSDPCLLYPICYCGVFSPNPT